MNLPTIKSIFSLIQEKAYFDCFVLLRTLQDRVLEMLYISINPVESDIWIKDHKNKIFREENILEFKSPEDYLSINDFYKVYGYVSFYKALNNVDISSLTITFISSRYPRDLIKHLQDIRKCQIVEKWPGIYYISGDFFPIQIIQSKKLSGAENIWLKSLNNDLDFKQAGAILKEGKGRASIGAYLYAILNANAQAAREVLKMSDGALTLDQVLEEAGLISKWEERGFEKGKQIVAENLLRKGWSIEETAEAAELDVASVRRLLK
jgi:hypothetical protein